MPKLSRNDGSGRFLQSVHKLSAGKRRRQRLTFLPIECYGLLHDPAQLVKNFSLIVSMTACVEKLRATPYETLVLPGPLDKLHVLGFSHF